MFDFLTNFASMYYKNRIEEIHDYATDALDTQNEQMFNLLSEAQETEWGKKYDFRSIFSYQDFRERLPLLQYNDIQPYVQRMLGGEENLLWPGSCKYFFPAVEKHNTNHYLPISQQMIEENFIQGIQDSYLIYLHLKQGSRIFDAYSLWLGAAPDHLPYRVFSSAIRSELPFMLGLMSLPKNIHAAGEDIQKVVDIALNEKISCFHGRPKRYADFLHLAEEKSGRQGVKNIWPNAEVFFHYGTPSSEQLQHPPVKDIDYFASYCTPEAFFGYQTVLNEPALMLMLDAGIFFEFLPIEAEIEACNVIPLEEVEIGKEYRVIISTCSGLWRYCSQGPSLKFVSTSPFKFIPSCKH